MRIKGYKKPITFCKATFNAQFSVISARIRESIVLTGVLRMDFALEVSAIATLTILSFILARTALLLLVLLHQTSMMVPPAYQLVLQQLTRILYPALVCLVLMTVGTVETSLKSVQPVCPLQKILPITTL